MKGTCTMYRTNTKSLRLILSKLTVQIVPPEQESFDSYIGSTSLKYSKLIF